MKYLVFVFLVLPVMLVFSGCMTIGREFETGNIITIQKGVTGMEEIRNMFGEPYRRGVEDGDLTWTYLQYKLKLFGDKNTRDLYIKFDSRGIVKSYTYNTSFSDEKTSPAGVPGGTSPAVIPEGVSPAPVPNGE